MRTEADFGGVHLQGMIRIADSHQRLAEARKDPPSRGFRGPGAANTLILDFWPPEPRDYKSVALSPTVYGTLLLIFLAPGPSHLSATPAKCSKGTRQHHIQHHIPILKSSLNTGHFLPERLPLCTSTASVNPTNNP